MISATNNSIIANYGASLNTIAHAHEGNNMNFYIRNKILEMFAQKKIFRKVFFKIKKQFARMSNMENTHEMRRICHFDGPWGRRTLPADIRFKNVRLKNRP